MAALLGNTGILQSLAGSGFAAKEYKALTSGNSMEYSGGGLLIVEGGSFAIVNLDDAINVRTNLFKDFSRGYAYGFATAASNQIQSITGVTTNTDSGAGGGIGGLSSDARAIYVIRPAQRLDFTYKSGTSGADKEVVKYDFYTIPFSERVKITATGTVYAIIYGE